jgi:hypothetical protein
METKAPPPSPIQKKFLDLDESLSLLEARVQMLTSKLAPVLDGEKDAANSNGRPVVEGQSPLETDIDARTVKLDNLSEQLAVLNARVRL